MNIRIVFISFLLIYHNIYALGENSRRKRTVQYVFDGLFGVLNNKPKNTPKTTQKLSSFSVQPRKTKTDDHNNHDDQSYGIVKF